MITLVLASGCGAVAAPTPSADSTRTAAPSDAPSSAASPADPPAASPTEPSAGGTSSRDPVRTVLERLTVEEKVGQLFMPVMYGATVTSSSPDNQAKFGVPTPAKAVAKYRPGGVIIFPWAGNVKNIKQVVALTNGLQDASPKVPLLIGADQENGRVSRLAPLVTPLPAAKVIGDTRDLSLARAAAKVTGTELRALGINLDFAPVADVNINPDNPVIGDRAYGSNPTRVASMVGAAVKGFHDARVASTAKHFPGHGDTSVDSHTGLPVINHTRAQWERLSAPPFRAAIRNGVDAIMSAHVVMPKLDPTGDPATLSKPILTGLLREHLGFNGVVSTDALDMAGVRDKYGDAEVAVRAILAGVDLLLMPPDMDKAYQGVLRAVKSGRIPAKRLDESVTRLLKLKAARGLLASAPRADAAKAATVLRSPEHRALANSLANGAGRR
ncbi:glycoside hydrolase family 3 protein [Sinosporangium album]|nr:glycoside hydrolase family 3 protein [Sinosporangium album]